jgi:hypothetical protein
MSIELPETPEWCNNAILIYGPKKAGTTMLMNLLDGTDQVLVFPTEVKLKFMAAQSWDDPKSTATKYYEHSLVLGEEFPNFDKEKYEVASREIRNYDVPSLRRMLSLDAHILYQSVTVKPAKIKCWAMKEVGGHAADVLALFRATFPQGKVITILREPLSVTSSVLRMFRRSGQTFNRGDVIRHAIDPVRVMYEQLRWLNDPNVHFVTYESLTGGGLRVEMERLATFLSIPYDDVLMRTTIFSESVVSRTSSRSAKHVFQNNQHWSKGLRLQEVLLSWWHSSRQKSTLCKATCLPSSYRAVCELLAEHRHSAENGNRDVSSETHR